MGLCMGDESSVLDIQPRVGADSGTWSALTGSHDTEIHNGAFGSHLNTIIKRLRHVSSGGFPQRAFAKGFRFKKNLWAVIILSSPTLLFTFVMIKQSLTVSAATSSIRTGRGSKAVCLEQYKMDFCKFEFSWESCCCARLCLMGQSWKEWKRKSIRRL